MAAKHLLSRARLLLTRHRSRPTILPPALTRLLFGGTTTQQPEDDKAKAAAVALTPRGPRDGSDDDDDENAGLPWRSWRPDVAWLTKALEPALQLYKHYNWKPFASTGGEDNIPASTRTFSEIISDLQHSKVSIQDWSLSDLNRPHLIYLTQASAKNAQAFKGVRICSNNKVAIRAVLLGLQSIACPPRNVLKFVKDSSILRPGYYIVIDPRSKLVIVGIRGTLKVYDLKVSPKGFSTHFGTYEAARWYLRHELSIIRKCLETHKDYKLRLVGHSLGGASAALLAIMLRKKSKEELGFSPDIVTAVGFGVPPCVSREIAESCASYVTTVVLQDDIVPRLSAASLARLRNEIIETDWAKVLEKEDWKHIVDIVTNAKLVVSSIQDVANKLADYAKVVTTSASSGDAAKAPRLQGPTKVLKPDGEEDVYVPEDLFLPGTLYYLQRDVENIKGVEDESYTLWRGDAGENFQRILLSGNLMSDHKCDSIQYALRDVLKTLPLPLPLQED
ncbi:hypothetical protein ZWY2020_054255 [Hordeum vulgare]|nr:hypothetical protein ZWY2020_054255 [Hordeum vulgare]